MAKKKAPTGLDAEELQALQAVLNAKRQNMETLASMTIALSNLREQEAAKIKEIAGNNLALQKLQEAYSEKYGDVNININSGEFVEAEAPAEE